MSTGGSTPILTGGVSVQVPGPVPPNTWNINGMFFDAWLRLNHSNMLTVTRHPVETGANISDHCFVEPKRFSFDIGMTDVFSSPAYPGTGTRSVNAYQALVDMMESRKLLTLTCKYGSYDNVLIESIDAPDDSKTVHAMKATINLVEIILVNTSIGKVTTNQHATNSTNRGKVSPRPALGTWELVVILWNELKRGIF